MAVGRAGGLVGAPAARVQPGIPPARGELAERLHDVVEQRVQRVLHEQVVVVGHVRVQVATCCCCCCCVVVVVVVVRQKSREEENI